MSEKKTAPNGDKNQKKLDESLKNLSARQRREARQEQQEQRRFRLYMIIGAIIAVLVAALLFWDSGFIQSRATAVTIGKRSYSAVDVDYYYYSQYNSTMSYASYYGLDPSVSLKKQEVYEGTTWYQYLCDNAKSSLTSVSMLAQEGEAAGYTISEQGQKNIDDAMADLTAAQEQYGVTADQYLHQMFGRYMTKSRYEKILNEYFYAYDYQDYKTSSFEVSNDEIDQYYKEHKDTLDTFDIDAYYVDALPETKYDEEGNEVEATEEETKAAAKAAKAAAEEIEAALKTGDEDKIAAAVEKAGAESRSAQEGSSLSSFAYSDWVLEDGRKAGDTTVYESATEEDGEIQAYYALRYNGRARDDYHPVTFRNILIRADENETEEDSEEVTYDYDAAKASIEELQKTWQDNGGTEDAFADLATEKSEDASSNANGGLYEDQRRNRQDASIDAWLFDESRKAGNTVILKDETQAGYQLLYFVSRNELFAWQQTAKDALQSDAFNNWYDEAVKNYEAVTTSMFRFVG